MQKSVQLYRVLILAMLIWVNEVDIVTDNINYISNDRIEAGIVIRQNSTFIDGSLIDKFTREYIHETSNMHKAIYIEPGEEVSVSCSMSVHGDGECDDIILIVWSNDEFSEQINELYANIRNFLLEKAPTINANNVTLNFGAVCAKISNAIYFMHKNKKILFATSILYKCCSNPAQLTIPTSMASASDKIGLRLKTYLTLKLPFTETGSVSLVDVYRCHTRLKFARVRIALLRNHPF